MSLLYWYLLGVLFTYGTFSDWGWQPILGSLLCPIVLPIRMGSFLRLAVGVA